MVSPEASLWLTHGYLLPVSSHSLSSGCVYTSVCLYIQISSSSLVAQMVKNLPAMQETQVQSLGREDLLEKEMATQSSILPGKSHGQRRLAGYSPWGRRESDMT